MTWHKEDKSINIPDSGLGDNFIDSRPDMQPATSKSSEVPLRYFQEFLRYLGSAAPEATRPYEPARLEGDQE